MFNFELLKRDEKILSYWEKKEYLKSQINSKKFNTEDYRTVITKNIKSIIGREELFYAFKTSNDLENYNIISITEPFEEKSKENMIVNCNDLLQLEFTDVRKYFPEEFFEKHKNEIQRITDKQFKQIKEFVIKNKDKPFIISCDVGISRSAAIGIYISKILEDEDGVEKIKKHKRYDENKLILEEIEKYI